MISITTHAGTLTYEPAGRIKEVLDAQTPENREKLEQHISILLTSLPRHLTKFSFGTQESINEILSSDSYDREG